MGILVPKAPCLLLTKITLRFFGLPEKLAPFFTWRCLTEGFYTGQKRDFLIFGTRVASFGGKIFDKFWRPPVSAWVA
jgi:hypothetical protein